MDQKLRVLFLCTGNSCRSQMAEGFCRHHRGNLIEAYSAGLEPHGLDPLATQAMKETGVDISGHKSKSIAELGRVDFDHVVTVCGQADENCPVFPAQTKVVHRGFADPPRLAANARSVAEAMHHYRRVRDEIEEFVLTLPAALGAG